MINGWTDQHTGVLRYTEVEKDIIIIPNRTFLVGFDGISGELGRAMVRILARRSRAKIARPNEPDMPDMPYLPYPNSYVGNSDSIVSVWLFKYVSKQLASVFQFSFGGKDFRAFFRPQNTR